MNGVGGTGIPRKCLYIISLNFITHKLGARSNFDVYVPIKLFWLQKLNLKMYVVLQKRSKNLINENNKDKKKKEIYKNIVLF